MKGDFTRFTHDPTKHYTRVYKQQGRAELDADFNEHADIAEHLDRTRATDIIGKSGAPKGDNFKIGVTANNQDLTIQPGHFYVDGILCELAAPASYINQPDYVLQPPLTPVLNRKDLVYLDVWERHITAVEDQELREPALNGPDTTTRVRTITQVKILPNVPPASTCANDIPNWPPAPSGGRLSTSSAAAGPSPNPCVLPPSGGYRGLENRLYRVEIHADGLLATALFKWSRDNASIVFPITFRPGETKRVTVAQLGRDQVLGLHIGDWVEVSGDASELQGAAGTLAQITAVSEADETLTLSKDINQHWQESHPKIRRWDQASDAIGMNGGAAILLEDGIQVSFSGTNFKSGDYWVFTARVGEADVEILNNAPPAGIHHHYARLALITWVSNPSNPGQILPAVDDCRLLFPPLTDIHASDVGFDGSVCQFGPGVETVQDAINELCKKNEECCTVVVRPEPGWEQVFQTIPAEGAHLCFRPGDYLVTKQVEVQNKQTIIISGVGQSTRLIAAQDECVLHFTGCSFITIRDIAAQGMVVQTGSGPQVGIRGTFAVENANEVTLENVRMRGTNGAHRTSACLSVHGATRATVTGCRMDVGIQQVGLLLVNVSQLHVENNHIVGAATSLINTIPSLVQDDQFRGTLRTRLVTHLHVGPNPPPNVPVNVTNISVGGQPVHFLGPITHVEQWKNLLATNPLSANSSIERIKQHIRHLAFRILLENPFPSFSGVRTAILGNATVSAQGITVAGTQAADVFITGNTISQVMQGIHVALSAPNPNISVVERAVIHDNRVNIVLGLGASRGRHGIFVGNVSSLSVRSNRLSLSRGTGTANMQVDGIRVFGRIGRYLMVRENHLSSFNNGVVMEVRGLIPNQPMWRINNNLAEGATVVVKAPAAADKNDNLA